VSRGAPATARGGPPQPEPTLLAGAADSTSASASASALEIPVYPTALPPVGQWHYRLLHDGRAGAALLQWRRDGEHYSASLDASDADGAPQLAMNSRGRIDGAGLAPERFVDRRGRRSAQAANFQRDDGAITYSGPASRAPLPAGAQDRLSLWLQLAAIVAAEPGRWHVGSTIVTYASGAHGDAEVWRWQVQGLEPVDADSAASAPARGGAQTLKLLRAAPRLYDTEAEAWLDPARGYLPRRLRWRNGAHVVELRLQP
jgi:hypothetical protein